MKWAQLLFLSSLSNNFCEVLVTEIEVCTNALERIIFLDSNIIFKLKYSIDVIILFDM